MTRARSWQMVRELRGSYLWKPQFHDSSCRPSHLTPIARSNRVADLLHKNHEFSDCFISHVLSHNLKVKEEVVSYSLVLYLIEQIPSPALPHAIE